MKAFTDQLLALDEVTEDQANAATAHIASHARSRAELALFMRMIQPAAYEVTPNPSDRRATPRWDQ